MTKEEIIFRLKRQHAEAIVLADLEPALVGYVDTGAPQLRALYDLRLACDLTKQRLGRGFSDADNAVEELLVKNWPSAAGMPLFAEIAEDYWPSLRASSQVSTLHVPERFNIRRCNACRDELNEIEFVRCGVTGPPNVTIYYEYECLSCGHTGRYVISPDCAATPAAALRYLAALMAMPF